MNRKSLVVGVLLVLAATAALSQLWGFIDLIPAIAVQVYYVAPDGSDSNPGTESRPFRTIQRGVDMAQAGDTVYVRAGTYHQEVGVPLAKSGTADNPITISGYPGERPVIDGEYTLPTGSNGECDVRPPYDCFNYSPLVHLLGRHIVFQGLEIKRSAGRGIQTGESRYEEKTHHVEIKDCWVHDTRETGIIAHDSEHILIEDSRIWHTGNFAPWVDGRGSTVLDWPGGLDTQRSSYVTIRGNEVFNCWGEGILPMGSDHVVIEDNIVYDNFAAQIYLERCSYATVQRNLIYHTNDPDFRRGGNPSDGLSFGDEDQFSDTPQRTRNITAINNLIMGNGENLCWWGNSEGTSGFIDSLIAHNTLVNAHKNSGNPSAISIEPGRHTGARVENNIILQDTGAIASVVSGLGFSHNLWSRQPPSQAQSPNDIVGDPQLAMTGPGELTPDYFRLLLSSPAIDNARVISEVTDDFLGNSRGSAPDMGAVEYGSAAPGTPTNTPTSTGTATATDAPTTVPEVTGTPWYDDCPDDPPPPTRLPTGTPWPTEPPCPPQPTCRSTKVWPTQPPNTPVASPTPRPCGVWPDQPE